MELEINTTFLFHHHFSESLNSLGQGPLPPPSKSAWCEVKKMVSATDQRSHKDCLQNAAAGGSAECAGDF